MITIDQEPALERPEPEMAVFRLEFAKAYPLVTMEAISDFWSIILEVDKISVAGLKRFFLNEHKTPQGGRFIVVRIDFEELVNKNSKRYQELHHAVISHLDPSLEFSFRDKYLKPWGTIFDSLCESIIRYLIWRKNLTGKDNFEKPAKTELQWSLDGIAGVDPHINQFWVEGEGLTINSADHTLTDEDFSDYYKIYTTGVPLHKELLMEGEHLLRSRRLRSALIMIYTSIEVGTKTLISTLQPETSWLLGHTASPNIHKLHLDYIPKFAEPIVTGKDLEGIRNLMNKRNDIAHTGVSPEYKFVLDSYFLVKRVLYIIDSRIGYTWAGSVEFPTIVDSEKDTFFKGFM